MEFCDIYGSFKAHCAYPGAVLQVPQYTFPILGGTEKIATISRPAASAELTIWN
jgi:hypothetical protein